jgi:hypothetical protein|nr:MAG TPA: hypothetical protein [Caudoviricetes sp.]
MEDQVNVGGLLKHLIIDQDENMLFVFNPDDMFIQKEDGTLAIREDAPKGKEVLNIDLLLEEMSLPRNQETVLALVYALLNKKDDEDFKNFA